MKTFKTLSGSKSVDLIPYIKEYMSQYPETEILIGCDSQNKKKETHYAIVIGLNRPGKGAHVLYSKISSVREKETLNRLLNEVWFSIEVAEQIKEEAGIRATWIDIDLNPDPKYRSNQVLTSAIGIVKGMGYNVRHKGDCPMMTYAADDIVK